MISGTRASLQQEKAKLLSLEKVPDFIPGMPCGTMQNLELYIGFPGKQTLRWSEFTEYQQESLRAYRRHNGKHRASQIAQWLRIYLPMQETQVPSPGQENPLEKEMATYSSILAWKIPRTEEAGRLQSLGCKESDITQGLKNKQWRAHVLQEVQLGVLRGIGGLVRSTHAINTCGRGGKKREQGWVSASSMGTSRLSCSVLVHEGLAFLSPWYPPLNESHLEREHK